MNRNTHIDYALFDRVMSKVDTTKLNMLEVCKLLYEATYVTYRSQWIQEWEEVQRLSTLIVTKNQQIEELESTIAMLKLKLSDYEEVEGVIPPREANPKEDNQTAKADTKVLPFRKGSKGRTGYPGHHRV